MNWKLYFFIFLLFFALESIFAENRNKGDLFHKLINHVLIPYKGKIEVIFFHPVIYDPDKAFDKKKFKQDDHYRILKSYFVTNNEFKKIIQSLYARHYMLIDIEQTYVKKNNKKKIGLIKKPIIFPLGKKPLLLTIDDLNYYSFSRTNGIVARLVLDDNGNLASCNINSDGHDEISYDRDIITILEEFILKHPDFVNNHARGLIGLTGMEGILGYPTHNFKAKEYEKNKIAVLKVIAKLKEKGWKFASHSYYHFMTNKMSLKTLTHDTLRWKKEVESLIGPTEHYIYPYGASPSTLSPHFKYLLKSGFNVFYGVYYLGQISFRNRYIFIERTPIDGQFLKREIKASQNTQFFSIEEVVDPKRFYYEKNILTYTNRMIGTMLKPFLNI